jgi:hypothetical protein
MDIEKNPGPVIDPSKTVHAPYSQGNIAVFGQTAGKQCVPMSLCALIYKFCKASITNPADLIQIMNIGNELYSVLSRLLGQSYLLLMNYQGWLKDIGNQNLMLYSISSSSEVIRKNVQNINC